MLSNSQDFFVYVILLPIVLIVIISLLLYKFWDNKPEFTHAMWFKFFYVAVLYIILVAIISLIYGLIR